MYKELKGSKKITLLIRWILGTLFNIKRVNCYYIGIGINARKVSK